MSDNDERQQQIIDAAAAVIIRLGYDKATMSDIAEEELRCARLHAKKQLTDETWEALWREWQDQRSAITATLEAMDRKTETHIATLDDQGKRIKVEKSNRTKTRHRAPPCNACV